MKNWKLFAKLKNRFHTFYFPVVEWMKNGILLEKPSNCPAKFLRDFAVVIL